MVLVNISGTNVDFPFEPYDVQRRYMEKVLECLRNNVNGVLESPTGTGKTLSLLCACLAYLEAYRTNLKVLMASQSENASMSNLIREPKLIYSMRTHSQVSHAFSEFLRTGYKNIKATVIGSRDQLCLHPDVSNESNKSIKINLCRSKVNSGSCHFYNNVESTLAVISSRKMAVDIEDLMDIGKKNQCCPYYLSRTLTREASVVFMPYNYLLDAKSRKFIDISVEGNIVIFDEAHNVEQLCEMSASSELRSRDIAVAISEVTFIMQNLASLTAAEGVSDVETFEESDRKVDFGLAEVCCIKTFLCELETQFDGVQLKDEGVTMSGTAIFQLMEKSGVTRENSLEIITVMEKLVSYLSVVVKTVGLRKGGSLQKCVDMISMLFRTDRSNNLVLLNDFLSYKLFMTLDETKKPNDVWSLAKQTNQPKVLHLWCFNPGISMRQLLAESPKCLIFTSGTLSPLTSFVSEMQIPIPIRLENPHVIQKSQMYAAVVSKGPDGVVLNSSYRTRSDLNYVISLGKTIINFSRVIPRGVLVFFPSYYLMKECHRIWEEHGVWYSLGTLKKIFVEAQGQDIQQLIEEYYKTNREPGGRGAIMMAVCRGKVSEGIDFADDNGRCVIITGLPFRPWKDPKVIGKMEYVSSQFNKKAVAFSGKQWYDLEGTRAVNQAVGRVIRHKDDYATILFCDERFANPNVQAQLSSWVKDFITTPSAFGFALRDVVHFFRPKKLASLNEEDKNSVTIHEISRPLGIKNSSPSAHDGKNEYSSEINSFEDAKVISSYSCTNSQSVTTPKLQTSLFTALNCDSVLPKAGTSSTASSPPTLRPPSPPSYETKRKKIKVIGPQQTYEMAVASDKKLSAEPQNLSPQDLLKNLKALLTSEQYKVFAAAIKRYHLDHDLEKFCNILTAICTNKAVHKSLLAIACLLPENSRAGYKSILQRSNVF